MANDKYIQVAGSFECVVAPPTAGWFGEVGEKKTPFVRLPVKVIEGPQSGKLATWKGWLSDKAFDNTIVRLKEVFGFDGDLGALHSGKVTLAGKRCNITTEIKTGNKGPICEVAWLNPPGGGAPKKMDEAKVSDILKKLTSRAKAVAKAAKIIAPATTPSAPPAPVTAEASAPSEAPDGTPPEDDVPF